MVVDFAGDDEVQTDQGLYLVYMHAGTNPFEVINEAVKYVTSLSLLLLISLKYMHLFDDFFCGEGRKNLLSSAQ